MYDFRSRRPAAGAKCSTAQPEHSDHFLYLLLPRACQAADTRALAYQTAFEYSRLGSQHCPTRSHDVAVAHVRTLDMDPSKPIHEG